MGGGGGNSNVCQKSWGSENWGEGSMLFGKNIKGGVLFCVLFLITSFLTI